MGRGRGKGKKQNSVTAREDADEEKIPTYKKRGRPQKPLKDEIEEEEEEEKAEKIEEGMENDENGKFSVSNKDVNNQAAAENGRKRKRSAQIKENSDSIKDENGVGIKSNDDDSIKFVGFRQNGSRRKNKPHRAAEVGVGCN